MTVKALLILLFKFESQHGDFEIWLSSDEEGNEFLPMNKDDKLSVGIEFDRGRLIFFPDHR
ncbi:MAG: hypothetical protein LLF76_09315 [Planctomycetaceae bacterium]|nr:hypothetical protein [Planctomycetaceae bacterium]